MKRSFVMSLICLIWFFGAVPVTVNSAELLHDDFESGLDVGVWDVRPNRGAQWIHAVESGNGYITVQPIGGSPYSQYHRFTQIITHQTDFGDFEMTWDMRYDNSGTHKDHRHIHFRSVWDQVTTPRGIIAPSTQGYFIWTGVNIPGLGSALAILRRNPDGYMTQLIPNIGYPWKLGVWYSHRLKVEGNEFKLKTWERGTEEPEGWTLTAVDPEAMYSQGGVGFGNYWAALTLVDNVTVTTPSPADQIRDIILQFVYLNLQTGIDVSLDAKLDNAIKALEDANLKNDIAAVNKLQAFINEVEAQRGNKIPVADADALIADVQAIIDQLTAP